LSREKAKRHVLASAEQVALVLASLWLLVGRVGGSVEKKDRNGYGWDVRLIRGHRGCERLHITARIPVPHGGGGVGHPLLRCAK